MHDAASGDHPVHVARPDRLAHAEAVLVKDFPLEKIGHCRKADMRMRPHVETRSRRQAHRAHLVEEHERADHAALHGRQCPVDLKAVAEIARRRSNDSFNDVRFSRHDSPLCAPPGGGVHAIFLPRFVGAFPPAVPRDARIPGWNSRPTATGTTRWPNAWSSSCSQFSTRSVALSVTRQM
jgi:hypothetical protein